MANKGDSIGALQQTIQSIIDIDPVPLSADDVPDHYPDWMIPISELDGEFIQTWDHLKSQVERELSICAYSSQFLATDHRSEPLVLLSEIKHPVSGDQVWLRIEYRVTGEIMIKSMVKPRIHDTINPFPATPEPFIHGCLSEITSEEVEQAAERIRQLKDQSSDHGD